MADFQYSYGMNPSDERFCNRVYSGRHLGGRIVYSYLIQNEIERFFLDEEDKDELFKVTSKRMFACWHEEVGHLFCEMFAIVEGGVKVCRVCRSVICNIYEGDLFKKMVYEYGMQSKYHTNECGGYCGPFCFCL